VGDLSYTYVVNHEFYSGFYRIRARSKHRAREKIEGWKGRMVVVRYSPDKHDRSALLKSDQPITAGAVKVVRGWVVDSALGQLDYGYRVVGAYLAGSIRRQYPDQQTASDFVDARRGKAVVAR
jgi:hypothetical protein